jgi:hypothetical protein
MCPAHNAFGTAALTKSSDPSEGSSQFGHPTRVARWTFLDLNTAGRERSHVSIVIVEHNLDLVLALDDRVFALERGAVVHSGPAEPLRNDLTYRKQILWI